MTLRFFEACSRQLQMSVQKQARCGCIAYQNLPCFCLAVALVLQLYLLFCSALLTECLEKALFVVESGVQLKQGWKKEIFVALKGTCFLIKPFFYFVFMYIVFTLFCMSSCFIWELCIISFAFCCDIYATGQHCYPYKQRYWKLVVIHL